ncbi:MAG TPA: energy transducer TonB [Thermoanaerobaculia bacterium]
MRSKRRLPRSRILCIAPVLALLPALLPAPLSAQLPASPATGAVPGLPVAQAIAEPPWIPVHPERQARLAGKPVHGICVGGTPPRKLAGGPPRLAPDSPLRRTGGVVVVHCLVDDEGYVVSLQVLKAPPGIDPQALAGALATWRFVPARDAGRPIVVHSMVAIPFPRDPTP